jgi:hypothetical protein
MRFDSRYATYDMVAAMAEAAGLLPAMPEDDDSSNTSSGEPESSSDSERSSSDE